MLKLYYAPRTRSIRVRWLLEELGLEHELVRMEFKPTVENFSQATPLGKFPVLEDGELVMGESGAIVEYILERYGGGKLAPPVGSPMRGQFLQWVHFAEGTLFPPMGVIIWHRVYLNNADEVVPAMESASSRTRVALDVVEKHLAKRDYLVGNEFSAADIMLGFSLAAAQLLGLFDDAYPKTQQYFSRLTARPAFQRATAD